MRPARDRQHRQGAGVVTRLNGGAAMTSRAWKTFKDRDDWIRLLLAADGDTLCPAAKIVATRIALHHNVKTGQCNPAIGDLVRGTGTSKSTILRMLRELEEKGWLAVDRSHGRYHHSFALRTPTVSTVAPFNGVNSDTVEESPTVSTVTPNGVNADTVTVSLLTPNKENLTAKRTSKEIDSPQLDLGNEDSGRRGRSPSDADTDFEEWYRQYPKHVERKAAEKAYRRVLKNG
jgi:hypothetical protein